MGTVPADSIMPDCIPDSQLIRFRHQPFKNVKTARLIIKQDLGEAHGIDLPLKADVIRLLSYVGVRENESVYDMTVHLSLKGTALAYQYRKRNSNGIEGTHYTSVKISAEVTFELTSGYKVTCQSDYSFHPPETIYEEHLTPSTAPFAETYTIPLANAFYYSTYQSFGLLPVIEVASYKGWQHYGDQADSFLLNLNDNKACQSMIIALQHQAGIESHVNGSLIIALGRQRDASAIKTLFFILQSHIEENRKLAELALNNIDPKWPLSDQARELLPSLYPTLTDHDNNLRQSTVHIISMVKNRQSLWYLILLSSDQDLSVRIAAQKLLKSDFPQWASSEEARRSIPFLVPSCISKDAGIRQSVVGTLNSIDPYWIRLPETVSVVPKLIRSLENPDREIRGNSAEVLGRIKDPRSVKPLIDLLVDDSRYSRERAIRALGELGDKSAIEPLIRLAESEIESFVAEEVRDALIMITGKDPGADKKSWHRWAGQN
jgi:HEAT repeat protein